MAHNPVDSSDTQNPDGAEAPASNAAPSGEVSDQGAPVGQGAGTVSELSDIVGLTDELHKAYTDFDPTVHAANPDGTPKLRKGGGYQLKRGRKPAAASVQVGQPSTSGEVSTPTAAPANKPQISNREAAQLLCGLTVGALQSMLDAEEWDPTASEAKGLHTSTLAYLEATGGLDMSPGVGLLFAWSGFALPRLTKPKTKGKLAQFGSWLVGLFRRG